MSYRFVRWGGEDAACERKADCFRVMRPAHLLVRYIDTIKDVEDELPLLPRSLCKSALVFAVSLAGDEINHYIQIRFATSTVTNCPIEAGMSHTVMAYKLPQEFTRFLTPITLGALPCLAPLARYINAHAFIVVTPTLGALMFLVLQTSLAPAAPAAFKIFRGYSVTLGALASVHSGIGTNIEGQVSLIALGALVESAGFQIAATSGDLIRLRRYLVFPVAIIFKEHLATFLGALVAVFVVLI